MEEKNVSFTGTISHITTEKTSNKFEGTGKVFFPSSDSFFLRIIVFSFTITVSLTITFSLFKFFGSDINFLFFPSGPAPPTGTEIINASEPISKHLKSFGIDSYIVVLGEFILSSEAADLEYRLRQKRMYPRNIVYNARYYVYVGPRYGKHRATSALHAAQRIGYKQAYILYPE